MKALKADALATTALAAASDPALRHRAHELAARMAGEDGLGSAIAALEQLGAPMQEADR